MHAFTHTIAILAKKSRIAFGVALMWQVMMLWSKSLLWRVLWPTDFGIFTLVGVITGLVATLAWLGLGTLVLRYLPVYKEQHNIGSLKWLTYFSVFLSLITSLVGAWGIYIFAPDIAQLIGWWVQLTYALQIAAVLVPAKVVSNLCRSYFLAHQNVILYHGSPQVLEPLLMMWAIVLARYMQRNVLLFIGVYTGAMVLLMVIEYMILHWRYIPKITVPYKLHSSRWLHFSLPLLVAWITYYLLNWADNIILWAFVWPEAVGIYAAGFVISHVLMLGKSSIQALFLPTIAEFYAHKEIENIKKLFNTLTWRIFACMLPLAVVLILFSKQWLILFYGEVYAAWSIVLILLIAWVMVNFTSWLTSWLLKLYKKTGTLSLIIFTATGVNIVANIRWVIWYGIEWVAVWTLLGFTTLNLLLLWSSRRYHQWSLNWYIIWVSILLITIVSAIVYGLTFIWSMHIIMQAVLIVWWYIAWWWVIYHTPSWKQKFTLSEK